jgi:acetolactate synthase-1/2/3 large subunit
MAAGIADAGVDRVFGLTGDDTVRLVSALLARGMSYTDARHENQAVAMATGYASASGRLGVCIISRGPGTANALTAAVNATRGDAPVLIITGDEALAPAANTSMLPDHKALDIAAVAGACDIDCITPRTPEAIMPALRDAISTALRGRTVLLALHRDLLEIPVAPHRETAAVVPPERPIEPAANAAITAAASVLRDARRPLILAGEGAWSSGARDALVQLADRLGGVLATTLRAKDMFAGHPYSVGIVGSFSHSAGRRLVDSADCVIVVGASLNRWTTSGGTGLPDVPVIQVDRDRAHIGRYSRADVAVVGDARLFVDQLLAILPERSAADKPWHTEETRMSLASFEPTDDFESAATKWAMDPRELVLGLDELLPADRAVVTDNGNFLGFVPSHISVPRPDRFKLSSDFAVIGLGMGTALGAAVARPHVPTVLFVGDGALLMSLGELETLARVDVPLIVVVMNDSAYGAEQHFLEMRGFAGSPAQFATTDFAEVAAAFGIEAATVRTVDELRSMAPRLGSSEGPLLLDCKVVSLAAPFLSGAH